MEPVSKCVFRDDAGRWGHKKAFLDWQFISVIFRGVKSWPGRRDGRLTCESCQSIDVREWARRGCLRPNQEFRVVVHVARLAAASRADRASPVPARWS